MKFDVNWTVTAEADLAQIWLDAADRAAVTSAAFEIDARLERDATQTGESRIKNLRVVIVAPLVVYFVVDDAARHVDVTHVRSFPVRGG